ncbi:nucleotide exchange factor GrpE [Oscillatoria salina]|uniref:nucleotide exchange factor GrpE n=1 Tax=Oscillatoria salina TaxID=331517 RepID=UPI0013BB6742|nr:nucleotide exchange factor GrpE [Oscillatoria salina]MBZ8180427.1 nucleotide exchange factor GrpE [Oscillatoria salina IIICB1]NET89019.1 nucleotide exchange factor GrpE [Kamptonema sp. SIO1D9]
MKNEQIFYLSSSQRDEILQELGNLLKDKVSLQQTLQQEQEQTTAANEELFLELLDLFDTLEFLLDYLTENPEPNAQFLKRLPKTIEVVKKKLLLILERREVRAIDFQENKPDFTLCRVVDCEINNEIEEDMITKIVRKGFSLGDKILRPVEVITSKKED